MYLAEMANLKMKFTFGGNRVNLNFMGYNESLFPLVEEFFKSLKTLDPRKYEIQYKDKLVQLKKEYSNFERKNPY